MEGSAARCSSGHRERESAGVGALSRVCHAGRHLRTGDSFGRAPRGRAFQAISTAVSRLRALQTGSSGDRRRPLCHGAVLGCIGGSGQACLAHADRGGRFQHRQTADRSPSTRRSNSLWRHPEGAAYWSAWRLPRISFVPSRAGRSVRRSSNQHEQPRFPLQAPRGRRRRLRLCESIPASRRSMTISGPTRPWTLAATDRGGRHAAAAFLLKAGPL